MKAPDMTGTHNRRDRSPDLDPRSHPALAKL